MSISNANAKIPELPPDKGTWDKEALSRRNFLQGTFAVLATVGAVHIGLPAVRFLIGDSLKPAEAKWVELGAVDSFPPDQMTRVNYSVKVTDAWREVLRRGTVYVYRHGDGADFEVLDGICTHLGCVVQWREGDGLFRCPCHTAVFNREGEVVSGPPPRPLRRLSAKVENNTLYAEI